jgi:hypothetical protein
MYRLTAESWQALTLDLPLPAMGEGAASNLTRVFRLKSQQVQWIAGVRIHPPDSDISQDESSLPQSKFVILKLSFAP